MIWESTFLVWHLRLSISAWWQFTNLFSHNCPTQARLAGFGICVILSYFSPRRLFLPVRISSSTPLPPNFTYQKFSSGEFTEAGWWVHGIHYMILFCMLKILHNQFLKEDMVLKNTVAGRANKKRNGQWKFPYSKNGWKTSAQWYIIFISSCFLFCPGLYQLLLINSFAFHWTFGSILEISVNYLSASQSSSIFFLQFYPLIKLYWVHNKFKHTTNSIKEDFLTPSNKTGLPSAFPHDNACFMSCQMSICLTRPMVCLSLLYLLSTL